jgi:hypothetical protein
MPEIHSVFHVYSRVINIPFVFERTSILCIEERNECNDGCLEGDAAVEPDTFHALQQQRREREL